MRDQTNISTGSKSAVDRQRGEPREGGADRGGVDTPGTHRMGLFAGRLISVARGYSWGFTSSSL